MQSIDISAMEEFKGNIDSEVNSYFEHKSAKQWIIDFVKGDWQFDPQEIISGIVKFFGRRDAG